MSVTHLLDTGWVIRHLRGRSAHTESLVRVGSSRLGIPIIALAELYEGVHLASNPAKAEAAIDTFVADKVILPITEGICRLFGQHRAQLRRQNLLIGDFDLLIAATCLFHDLTLLTTNRAHFERVPGLKIVSDPSMVN